MAPSDTPPGLVLSGEVRIGDAPLLRGLDLVAPSGMWTCLLGASGVGKSTVLRLFAGIADGVTLRGAVRASDGLPLKGRVAMMAQADMLLPWLTLRDNVLLGARLRGEPPDPARATAILEEVGLIAFATRKPGALSGGERQRVSLARVLMEDRPVVLLDEPFSALDVATRARMQDLAATLLRGRTVLQVTHDPAEAARMGDKIHVLTTDGLLAADPPSEPAPRAPDAPGTLAATGRLTRLLMEHAA